MASLEAFPRIQKWESFCQANLALQKRRRLRPLMTSYAASQVSHDTLTINESPSNDERIPAVIEERNPSKRVFVCITGQLERLIVREKIDSLFKPLQDAGYDLDIALVVSEGSASFVNAPPNRSSTGPEVESWEEVAALLSDYNVLPYRMPPLTATMDRMKDTNYERNLNKDKKTRLYRSYLHMKQMETLSHCMDALPDQEYTFLMRLRDDVALAPPLDTQRVLPRLLENTGPAIMVTDCNNWKGMNDRMALVTPEAGKVYFRLPYDGLSANVTIHTEDGSKTKPEVYYLDTYTDANVQIDQFPGLRNVFKYFWDPVAQTAVVPRKEDYRCRRQDQATEKYSVTFTDA